MLIPAPLTSMPAAPPPEQTRVEYVLVEVIARDHQGRLVTDLGLDDFILTDAGRRVRVESLDILDLRSAAAPSSAPARTPALPSAGHSRLRRQQVILAVDFEYTRYDEAIETFRQLEEYLAAIEPLPGLEYLLWSLEGAALTVGFTADLRDALPLLADYREAYRERRRRGGDDRIGEGDIADLERQFRRCVDLSVDAVALWNCIQSELEAYLAGQEARALGTIRAMEELLRRFPDPESRTAIVLISPGFSPSPGRAAVRLARRYFPGDRPLPRPQPGRPPTESGARTVLPQPVLRSFAEEIRRFLGLCAANHVVFHTFDVFHFGLEERRRTDAALARGGDAIQDIYRTYREEMDEGMRILAQETGGSFHGGPSLRHLRPVLEGDRFVYVLGYPAPGGERGRFRTIRIKCRRKGIILAHRRGYVR